MKHIMIVTASTGGGHNSAAGNLKKSFEERGIYAQVIDMFKVTSKAVSSIMTNGYHLLAEKMPKTYGALYDFFKLKGVNKLLIQSFFIQTTFRLSWLFQELEPDLVVSLHPIGAQLIGNLKQQGRLKAPFMQIVTDFKVHDIYKHKEVDAYIVASHYTRDTLIGSGIEKDKIYVYGIPVKEEFYKISARLFLPEKPLHLLVVAGSMGLSVMEQVIDELVSLDFSEKLRLSVVCGKNKELCEKFNNEFKDYIQEGKMIVYGFVENMAELMETCDLIITKPGGLTSSEAINKCIPMIIPFVIPGQEKENAEFLVEYNMAIDVKDISQLGAYLKKLIDHPEIYMEMVNNMERLNKSYSIDKIVDLAIELIGD